MATQAAARSVPGDRTTASDGADIFVDVSHYTSEVASEALRQPMPLPSSSAAMLEVRRRPRPPPLQGSEAEERGRLGCRSRGSRPLRPCASAGDASPPSGAVDLQAVAGIVAAAAEAGWPPRSASFPTLPAAAVPSPEEGTAGGASSMFKPVKRGLDQAMCWVLGIDYAPLKQPGALPATPATTAWSGSGSTRSQSLAAMSSASSTSSGSPSEGGACSTPTSTNTSLRIESTRALPSDAVVVEPEAAAPARLRPGPPVLGRSPASGGPGSTRASWRSPPPSVERGDRLQQRPAPRAEVQHDSTIGVRWWSRDEASPAPVVHEAAEEPSMGLTWQEGETACAPSQSHCGILRASAAPMERVSAAGLAARWWSGGGAAAEAPSRCSATGNGVSSEWHRDDAAQASCGMLGNGGGSRGSGHTYLAQALFPNCFSGGPRHSYADVRTHVQQEEPELSPRAGTALRNDSPSLATLSGEQREREELMQELFRLHDLNGDGELEELELIQLNKKVAMLHHGDDVDKHEVQVQFSRLFRSKLDPSGRPVSYPVFRKYMFDTLRELDRNPLAQTMILEQFVAEADSAERVFRSMSMYSTSDEPLLKGVQVEPEHPRSDATRSQGDELAAEGGCHKSFRSDVSDEVLSGESTGVPEPAALLNSESDMEGPIGEGL